MMFISWYSKVEGPFVVLSDEICLGAAAVKLHSSSYVDIKGLWTVGSQRFVSDIHYIFSVTVTVQVSNQALSRSPAPAASTFWTAAAASTHSIIHQDTGNSLSGSRFDEAGINPFPVIRHFLLLPTARQIGTRLSRFWMWMCYYDLRKPIASRFATPRRFEKWSRSSKSFT